MLHHRLLLQLVLLRTGKLHMNQLVQILLLRLRFNHRRMLMRTGLGRTLEVNP